MTDSVEIVLVRHASTAWTGRRYCGRSDPPLSAAGRIEATALADRLCPLLAPGTRIVAGMSRRATATADAIATAADLFPVQIDPRWDETDFGHVEGLRFDEVAAVRPRLAERILAGSTDIDWPGGETAVALATRIESAWHDLVEAARPAVVVTHAGPILQALRLARLDGTEEPQDDDVVADIRDVPAPASEIRVRVRLGAAHRPGVLPSPA